MNNRNNPINQIHKFRALKNQNLKEDKNHNNRIKAKKSNRNNMLKKDHQIGVKMI